MWRNDHTSTRSRNHLDEFQFPSCDIMITTEYNVRMQVYDEEGVCIWTVDARIAEGDQIKMRLFKYLNHINYSETE